MMNKIILGLGALSSGSALAHVADVSTMQHSTEHLLLAAIVLPLVGLVAFRVFK